MGKGPSLRGGRVRWAAALLAAGLLLAALALRDRSGGGPDRFPPISISTIDGRSFDPATIEGRPLLVTFWSTTCLICLREMPDLEALYRRLSPHGFEIIAVSMLWDPPGEVVRLARSRELPYPVALDVDGAIARAFGDVSATPTHFLVGPSGDVAFRRAGALDFPGLDRRIQSMLGPMRTSEAAVPSGLDRRLRSMLGRSGASPVAGISGPAPRSRSVP